MDFVFSIIFIVVGEKEQIKFVVDCMLGKLAKWMRILGFDVVYFKTANDEEILKLCLNEGRIILTRDRNLFNIAKKSRAFLVKSDQWEEQAKEVIDNYNLWDKISPFSRCLNCNYPLKIIEKSSAKNLVPPFPYETFDEFAVCPECGKTYWPGTHFDVMRLKITKLINDN
ncbi:MAG: Mut7-C RNAse domain-containing protein [Acidobacteriota bacterium]